ncbi:hypothetical protein V5K00_RS23295 [Enterobacter asburiae]
MSKSLSAATFECEIIFWLRALFPGHPDAKDFVRFFPDVSIPELIKCLAGLTDRQLVSGAALRYEDGDAYLSFQGLVLTAEGCTYAQQLARGCADKNNVYPPR